MGTSILPELKSWSPSGKKYSRTSSVNDEIQMMMRRHQEEWILEAADLKSETIVFLMRLVRRANQQLFYEFFQELCARIARITRRWAAVHGIDPKDIPGIIADLALNILELVLAERPCRQSEVLEFAFGQAIKNRALNLARKHQNSMQAHMDYIDVPTDYVEPVTPNPEAVAINNVLMDRAWAVIDDPRIFQA